MKKRTKIILGFVITIMTMTLAGCHRETKRDCSSDLSNVEATFWGDSTTVLIANQLQNGYKVSIINNQELCLFHFERGDSISQYFAVHRLPRDLRHYEEDSIGVFHVDVDFPVLKLDTIGGCQEIPDMFFMDVNFDDEEEFVVRYEGYNRFYYACFDLVNGNYKGACPGLLESIQDEPYNNLVSGIEEQQAYTVFDRQKKEMYIYESIGCCRNVETWAKWFEGDIYGTKAQVKVIKKVESDWLYGDGTQHIDTYLLQNDTLRLVKREKIPF